MELSSWNRRSRRPRSAAPQGLYLEVALKIRLPRDQDPALPWFPALLPGGVQSPWNQVYHPVSRYASFSHSLVNRKKPRSVDRGFLTCWKQWFIGQLSCLLVRLSLCPLHGGHRRGITCLLGALFYIGRTLFSSFQWWIQGSLNAHCFV